MLTYILIATIVVSLVSFVGLFISSKIISKFIHYLISFAAASLIAVAFFDLIPEGIENSFLTIEQSMIFVVFGIVLFFTIEGMIHWHHCCEGNKSNKKTTSILILAGDFVHNFFDGIIIAGAFLSNFETGILITFSVIVHEIPQEFGDFVILLHGGFKKKKALKLNFYSALSAIVGGVLGYFVFDFVNSIIPYAILVSAGGFLYLALSDIVPSMHEHEKDKKTRIKETIIFVLTLVFFKFFLNFVHVH